MSDSTRSRILEVMARAMGAPVEGPEGEKWGEYPPFKRFADLALTAYESHLEAEGMAVVPVELVERARLLLRLIEDENLHGGDVVDPSCDICMAHKGLGDLLPASPSIIPPGKEESK